MTTASTTTQVFAIDASHTSAEFIVRHMMIAKVRGRFTALAGTIEATDAGRRPTSIRATIETKSVATGVDQRDDHLRSADFFEAETYPTIEFKSTKIVPDGEAFDVHGDLTIHGTTLPVILKATFEGASTDPYGNERIGYEATAKISRKDFGLVYNAALETGGVAVGDEVKIELSVEAIVQK